MGRGPGIFLIMLFGAACVHSQGLNKIVFGPLEGDNAGVLTVENGQAIEVEVWVRTDPENPSVVCALAHGLLSADSIISSRNGMNLEAEYDQPNWELVWVDGPYVHNPDDPFPIPEASTSEVQNAFCIWCECFLDTGGEWDFYGTWLMVADTDVPTEQTYYPFSMGWYPHSGHGTQWSFGNPPGGGVIPDQDYCGLYFEPTTATDEENERPANFTLVQNYPNPFNASTTIAYGLPRDSEITIEIFDILGREVELLVQEERPAGYHRAIWDVGDCPSGIYFYRLEAGDHVETRSCLLLK